MGEPTPLLQLVDEIARFIGAVKPVAAKLPAMKKAAAWAAFDPDREEDGGAASP